MKPLSPKFKVEWLPLDQLNPYTNNPKEHPPEQVQQIADSIRVFGFNDPIALDADNVIIEGHGRLLAAQSLGLVKVPVIHLTHLTEAQRKAYALAHNKLTLNTGWDFDKLQAEFEQLQELDFADLGLTGFVPEELQDLVFGTEVLEKTETTEEGQKTEVSIHYQNQYAVIVTCENEAHQQRVYEELIEAGYPCKVVVV